MSKLTGDEHISSRGELMKLTVNNFNSRASGQINLVPVHASSGKFRSGDQV
jgi:hypothetical protein